MSDGSDDDENMIVMKTMLMRMVVIVMMMMVMIGYDDDDFAICSLSHPSIDHHHLVSVSLPLQAANNPVGYKGVTDCFVRILREEGIGTFYR